MTTNATTDVAPPKTPAGRGAYTEQLHVLVDMQMKEYVMGLAGQIAEAAGYKFIRQGEAIRELLAAEVGRRYDADPEAYADLVRKGRRILAESAAPAPAKRA